MSVVVILGILFCVLYSYRLLGWFQKTTIEQTSPEWFDIFLDADDGWVNTGIKVCKDCIFQAETGSKGIFLIRVGNEQYKVKEHSVKSFSSDGKLEIRVSQESPVPKFKVTILSGEVQK